MTLPVAAISLVTVAYAVGLLRLRSRARRGDSAGGMRILSMIGGLAVLLIALGSPLDELAERLLSAHMAQHLLLMMAAAPLLVWAQPLPAFLCFLPGRLRTPAARIAVALLPSGQRRVLFHPALAGVVFCAALGFWHLPAIYRWMLRSELRHILMHLTFLGSAMLFWAVILKPAARTRGRNIVLVLATAFITALPGAVLTFASSPIYSEGSGTTLPFSLTPLQDQQLAGLLMWIPMDLVLFGVAAALFHAWLATPDSDATRRAEMRTQA